jgi:predicted lipoprotein with Yx(FWY)xxD motif
MTSRSKAICIVVALAGLVSVTGCENRLAKDGGQAAAPVAVAQNSSEAPLDPQGPAEPPELAGAGGADVDAPTDPSAPATPPPTPSATQSAGAAGGAAGDDADEQPAVAPTVAKKQKWVKIFSGPSDKDITPPKSRTSGSKVVELNATESDQIGTYVTDGAGRTLYRFDNDSNKPPKSVCNGDCATAWPPLLIKSPGKIFPNGLDPKILGYVERADGTCQVTINGWPVYYFVSDAKAGDLNGQGLNGKWFAVKPDGGKTAALPGPLSGGK